VTAAEGFRHAFPAQRLPLTYIQEVVMKTLRVLDSSGDREISFDDTDATALARQQARALFERMLACGSTAFKVNRGESRGDEKVTEFSALENETILVPRIVGG
jgi:hypothetical protein